MLKHNDSSHMQKQEWEYAEPSPISLQQRGFTFVRWGLNGLGGLQRKNSIYNVSYFNLGGWSIVSVAKPTKAPQWRRDWEYD